MIIKNRIFFIAENVSGHYTCRFAAEILQRGGDLVFNRDDYADYEILDAEMPYCPQSRWKQETAPVKLTVNEIIRYFDTMPECEHKEFIVKNGELVYWIPSERTDTVMIIPEGVKRIITDSFSPFYPEQKKSFMKAKRIIWRVGFPKSLEVIEPDAFKGFRGLEEVRFYNLARIPRLILRIRRG